MTRWWRLVFFSLRTIKKRWPVCHSMPMTAPSPLAPPVGTWSSTVWLLMCPANPLVMEATRLVHFTVDLLWINQTSPDSESELNKYDNFEVPLQLFSCWISAHPWPEAVSTEAIPAGQHFWQWQHGPVGRQHTKRDPCLWQCPQSSRLWFGLLSC